MSITINGTTGIAGVDGSAGTPAIQGTDTNTGEFFPAADTIAWTTGGSERMRIDSTGSVGIGTTAAISSTANRTYLSLKGTGTTASDGLGVLQFQTNSAGSTSPNIGNIEWSLPDNSGSSAYRVAYMSVNGDGSTANNRGSSMSFATKADGVSGSGTTRMVIDSSGNVLVATSTAPSGTVNGYAIGATTGISGSTNNNTALWLYRTGNDGAVAAFYRAATNVGSISVTASATAYNTSSDYRLKDITGSVTGAKDFIMALQPKQGTWKVDGSKFVGFLAHEFQEVSPSSVVGDKDAVDADGKPIMQAMQASSSEVMANLVAFIQEQQAIIVQLQADVATLKAAMPQG